MKRKCTPRSRTTTRRTDGRRLDRHCTAAVPVCPDSHGDRSHCPPPVSLREDGEHFPAVVRCGTDLTVSGGSRGGVPTPSPAVPALCPRRGRHPHTGGYHHALPTAR